ncbi:MAG: CHASE3 domain-containing protein, partial [Cyanobacteria bacterium J06555_12]
MKQETFTFKQRVLGGFAIPIAVFIAASGFTIAQVGKVNRTSRKLMADQLILKDLLELSSDLNHLELSAENYAIAGNESYYEAYQDDKQHVGELLLELENLDGDLHGDLVADLTQKSNELIGLSDRLVNLVRQGNPERALEIMRTGSADNLMRETSN